MGDLLTPPPMPDWLWAVTVMAVGIVGVVVLATCDATDLVAVLRLPLR